MLTTSDRPLRLAFVGQSTFFEACALDSRHVARFDTRFHEFRGGADVERAARPRSAAFDPDVVVVFRPEIIPAGAFAGPARDDARLPDRAAAAHRRGERQPRGPRPPALGARARSTGRTSTASSPSTRSSRRPPTASCRSGARSRCRSPTATTAPSTRRTRPPPPLFVGRSTEHREASSSPAKHRFDVLHLAFGVDAARLERLHGRALDRDQHPQRAVPELREPRAACTSPPATSCCSEPLSPTHGLEPGIDFLEFRAAEHLRACLETLRRDATVGTPCACAGGARPSSSAPRASSRAWSPTCSTTCAPSAPRRWPPRAPRRRAAPRARRRRSRRRRRRS